MGPRGPDSRRFRAARDLHRNRTGHAANEERHVTGTIGMRAGRKQMLRNLEARVIDGSVLIVAAALLVLLARVVGS